MVPLIVGGTRCNDCPHSPRLARLESRKRFQDRRYNCSLFCSVVCCISLLEQFRRCNHICLGESSPKMALVAGAAVASAVGAAMYLDAKYSLSKDLNGIVSAVRATKLWTQAGKDLR